MESLHIIKGLWNLSNIRAENSDTKDKAGTGFFGQSGKRVAGCALDFQPV